MDIYPEPERRRGGTLWLLVHFPRKTDIVVSLRSIAACLIPTTVKRRQGVGLGVTIISLQYGTGASSMGF